MRNVVSGAVAAMLVMMVPVGSYAADKAVTKTVEQVYAQKTQLSGKLVHLTGKVVKVNNGIMGKNFLHIQDGTGAKGSNDITVTSQQTAKIGDKLDVEAKVILNRDFGMGYSYPVILEEAKLSPAK